MTSLTNGIMNNKSWDINRFYSRGKFLLTRDNLRKQAIYIFKMVNKIKLFKCSQNYNNIKWSRNYYQIEEWALLEGHVDNKIQWVILQEVMPADKWIFQKVQGVLVIRWLSFIENRLNGKTRQVIGKAAANFICNADYLKIIKRL